MTQENRYSLFIALAGFLVSIFLFYPASDAGRVHDFTGFYLKMKDGTFVQAFLSFEYNVVQPFLQVFNLLIFKIAGRSGLVYFLIFHILFGLGLFAWSKFLLKVSGNIWLPIMVLLTFTLNPYVVEVLIYKVCQAYLISFICLGFYHYYLHEFLKSGSISNLFILLSLLLIQMWTFDFLLVYPLLTFLFYGLSNGAFKLKNWLALMLLNLLIVGLYFIENKLALGTWVGHYGSNVHFSLDIRNQLATIVKYFIKHLGLGQFFSYPIRHQLYGYAGHLLSIFGLVLFSIFGLIRLFRWREKDVKFNLGVYFLLAGILLLIPVSNLTFLDLMLTENDRYGFLFGFFLLAGLVSFAFYIPNKKIMYSLIGAFIIVQVVFQQKLIRTWVEGQQIVRTCLEKLPPEAFDPGEKILFLNLPDNYKGVYLFKNLFKESELLEETYISQIKDTTFADLKVVAQMNMVKEEDGARASFTDDFNLKVELNQYGTWWWRNGNGAYSYEAADYKMNLEGLLYTLSLKNTEGKLFIWDSRDWEEVEK